MSQFTKTFFARKKSFLTGRNLGVKGIKFVLNPQNVQIFSIFLGISDNTRVIIQNRFKLENIGDESSFCSSHSSNNDKGVFLELAFKYLNNIQPYFQ